MKNKVLHILVAILLTAFLGACGGGSSGGSNSSGDVGNDSGQGGDDQGGDDQGGDDQGGDDQGGDDQGGDDQGGDDQGGDDQGGDDQGGDDQGGDDQGGDDQGGDDQGGDDQGGDDQGGDDQGGDDTGVTLADLQTEIFTPRCSGCHGGVSPSAGMNLSSEQLTFDNTVNVAAGGENNTDLKRIEPNNPTDSYLIRKLNGGPGIDGSQMPLGGQLSQAQIDKISDWISNGAPREGTGVASGKVNRIAVAQEDDRVNFKLHFSRALQKESVSEDDVQVYLHDGDTEWLIDADKVSVGVESQDLNVNVDVTAEQADTVELIVNSESTSSILDITGRNIDGNNDGSDGGAYSHQYKLQ